MDYESAYKYAVDMAVKFIKEEDGIAANSTTDVKTIYTDKHHIYSLLAFAYPNLWTEEGRNQHHAIVTNEIRQQILVRARQTALAIVALTGIEFVNQLNRNYIDLLMMNSRLGNTRKSRALRKELETYLVNHPNTWFCVVASGVYTNEVVSHSYAVKKSATSQLISPGTAPKTRTVV